jgi:signal peptide peptidase SppA
MRSYLQTLFVSDMTSDEADQRTGPTSIRLFDCECEPISLGENADLDPRAAIEAAVRTRKTARAIAVIPMLGPITQRPSLFAAFFGGTSTAKFGQAFDDLVSNPSIGAIVIDADTPGGEVAGTPELASKIFHARGKKPIVTVANGWLASAGYWIGTAADQVVVAPSGSVGSIGVRTMHVDVSKMLEEMGQSVTLISAGKHKIENNPFEALTADGKAFLQSEVNRHYGEFVSAVAAHRDVTASAVRNGFGEGRMLGPKDAKAAGMVDRIGTLEETIARLGGNLSDRAAERVAAVERRERLDALDGWLGV